MVIVVVMDNVRFGLEEDLGVSIQTLRICGNNYLSVKRAGIST